MTADGGDYYVNGVQHGVDLDPGKLYKFDVYHGSMADHPLALSTTYANGDVYDGSGYSRDTDGNVWLLAAADRGLYCEDHGEEGEAPLFPATPATGTVLSFEGYTDGFEDHAAFGRNTTRDVGDKTEEDGTTVLPCRRSRRPTARTGGPGLTWSPRTSGRTSWVTAPRPSPCVFADQDGPEPRGGGANMDNVYAVTETVAAGWNNVSFDLSAPRPGPTGARPCSARRDGRR